MKAPRYQLGKIVVKLTVCPAVPVKLYANSADDTELIVFEAVVANEIVGLVLLLVSDSVALPELPFHGIARKVYVPVEPKTFPLV